MRFALPSEYPANKQSLFALRCYGGDPNEVLRNDWVFQIETLRMCEGALNDDDTVLLEPVTA